VSLGLKSFVLAGILYHKRNDPTTIITFIISLDAAFSRKYKKTPPGGVVFITVYVIFIVKGVLIEPFGNDKVYPKFEYV